MKLKESIDFRNPFIVRHYDKNGKLKGIYKTKNGIVDVGINYLLDVGFNGISQITSWFMGLVDASGFSQFANSDTMSSHSGWTEDTDYSEATRPAWNPDSAASRAITNSTTTDFSINAAGTIKGIFIVSDSTKGGTSGTLWATAAFASDVSVANGDVLKITYTVSG